MPGTVSKYFMHINLTDPNTNSYKIFTIIIPVLLYGEGNIEKLSNLPKVISQNLNPVFF